MDNKINPKMKIPITFKEDERWLYNKIRSHSSRSGYIKDILKKYLLSELNKENTEISINQKIPKNNNLLKGIEELIHTE